MSFKLRPEWGPLPCSMNEGVITVEDHLVEDIKLPGNFGNLIFEKQHFNFSNRNIQCLLENDTYVFVLRFDGSYSIYLKANNCICVNGPKTNVPVYLFDINTCKSTINGGILNSANKEIITTCRLVELKGVTYLFCDNNNVIGVNVDKSCYYYNYCKSNSNPIYPELMFDDEYGLCIASLARTPVVVEKFYNLELPTYYKPKRGGLR